jgi:hypothetical protein
VDDRYDDGPTPVTRAAPLTGRERRIVVAVALLPLGLAGVVVVLAGRNLGAGVGEILAAVLVYGGLLGLAAGFVTIDRLHARQCPRCHERARRGAEACPACGYDLRERPRFTCDQGHGPYLDDRGLCPCGRRLVRLPTVRGIGREVVLVLKMGAWLLALLVGIAIALRVLERSL